MSGPRAAARAVVLVLVGMLTAVVPGPRADRIELTGGGQIRTDSWRTTDGTLFYESAAGTIGIPLANVVRIVPEHAALRPDEPAGPAPTPRPAPPTTRPRTTTADPRIARRLSDAGQAFDARDYVTASSLFWSALLAEPELVLARAGYAASEMALGRDSAAENAVRDGLVLAPRQPVLLELAGDLANRDERVEDALTAWREAFEVAPTDRLRDKIIKAERELHAARDYDLSRTAHFTLRYDGEVDRALAREVTDYLEQRFFELARQFDHTPQQPITVVLYPRRQFLDVTSSAEWVGGVYDGKIRVPLAGLSRLDDRARRLLTHELTHAVVHAKTGNHCPRWLHEGLAQRAEGRTVSQAELAQARQALQRGDPERWEGDELSYPLALSLTLHLESRRGEHGLVDLLDRLAAGATLDAAAVEVYGEDYAGLCRSWARALARDDR